MEELITNAVRGMTALDAIVVTFLGLTFYLFPKVFYHYEKRIQAICEGHRVEIKEQEVRHRDEMKEITDKFCRSLESIQESLAGRLDNIERKIDSLKT